MRRLLEVAVALMAAAVLLAAAADVAAHEAWGPGDKAFQLLRGNQQTKDRSTVRLGYTEPLQKRALARALQRVT